VITAVDTSVLLDVFAADPTYVEASKACLRRAIHEGTLIACEVVWAELRPCFDSDEALLAAAETLNLGFSAMTRDAAPLARKAWLEYRRSGGSRRRMIPDFLIAAHAQSAADRLLTRDRGFYHRCFRGLLLLESRR